MKDLVGKKDLAAELGWSRPTLDKRLKTDAKFPVANRGDQAGGWLFSLKKVHAYLGGAKAAPPPAIDLKQLAREVAPPVPKPEPAVRRSAEHKGEATARQRKDEADASLREIKLGEVAGEFVRRDEVSQLAGELFGVLGGDLDSAAEEIVRRCALAEDLAPKIRDVIDDIRVAMVRRLEPYLAEPRDT